MTEPSYKRNEYLHREAFNRLTWAQKDHLINNVNMYLLCPNKNNDQHGSSYAAKLNQLLAPWIRIMGTYDRRAFRINVTQALLLMAIMAADPKLKHDLIRQESGYGCTAWDLKKTNATYIHIVDSLLSFYVGMIDDDMVCTNAYWQCNDLTKHLNWIYLKSNRY